MTNGDIVISTTVLLCTIFILGALRGMQNTAPKQRRIAVSMWVLVAVMALHLAEAIR